ncbi:MAG: desulfoferrodoxin family protein [Erysipelotrichaceae bacterium]|nr:desulfoferrodoxin family protein [Erysipelotrichaceae bacterium]
MKQELKFYLCHHCGNIIVKVKNSGVPVVCCGSPMDEIIANTTDGAHEKHVPVVTVTDHKVEVKVGSVPHPMIPEHYIQWIVVETEKGFQIHYLEPSDQPEAVFYVEEPIIAVYEYCNLHGLWKTFG